MDKKVRAHRRSPSSSSSSSSSSSTSSSSSSSSSSYDSRRGGTAGGQGRGSRGGGGGGSHKRENVSRQLRKSRSTKRVPSGNDRAKGKKIKSSSSSRKHNSAKVGSRKANHNIRKDYKDFTSKDYKDFSTKDYGGIHTHKGNRSPTRHHRRSSSSKKLISPTPIVSRKARKQISPASHKRGHKRSVSPREKLDYHPRVIERPVIHNRDSSMGPTSSSRPRDPRIDDRLKRSPDVIGRDRYSVRDSPRHYEREEYNERRDKRSASIGVRPRELDRKEPPPRPPRGYDHHEREGFDDRCRDELRRDERDKDPRERDPREKKLVRDREVYKERERNLITERERDRDPEDRRGRFQRDPEFLRERELLLRPGREYEDEREYYPRGPGIDSRESSLERPYEDAYERFSERERVRYEGGVNRYEDLLPQDHRGSAGEYSPIEDMRVPEDRRGRPPPPPPPIEARFPDDRRKSGPPLERPHHDVWEDPRSAGGVGLITGSIVDRLQEKTDHHHYPHHPSHMPNPHQGPPLPHRRGEWIEPVAGVGRQHPGQLWEKHHPKKRRGNDWSEEYPVGGGGERGDWVEGAEWGPEPRERMLPPVPHDKGWVPPHARRYHGNWNEGERGPEWGGISIQERLGNRGPSIQAPHHPMNRELQGTLHPSQRRNLNRKEAGLLEQDALKGAPTTLLEPINREDIEMFSPTIPPPKRPMQPILDSSVEHVSPMKQIRVETISQIQPQLNVPPPQNSVIIEPVLIEKDNFSDFSDDPDDILNQEVVEVTSICVTKEPPSDEVKPAIKDLPSYEDILEEEERMDLEEISDDEFEEEKQAKFSVADALDINWSSLISDSRIGPTPTQGSALKRFRPLHLLSRLGVSTKYARSEVLQSITEACLKIEEQKTNSDNQRLNIKAEKVPKIFAENEEKSSENVGEGNQETVSMLKEIKQELDDSEINTNKIEEILGEPLPEILPVVAPGGVVKYLRQQSMARSRLFSLGPHRRALCAREDLALRRRLCNLPEQNLIGPNARYDKKLFSEAVSLLKSH